MPNGCTICPCKCAQSIDYLATAVDVCLLQVAFDRNGVLRVGPNVDFVAAVLSGAKGGNRRVESAHRSALRVSAN